MKRTIPLEVYFFAGGLRPMINLLIRSEEPKIFLPVTAVVDTGSPVTLISISDMKRMRLSQLQLKKTIGKTKPLGVGGGEVNARIIENAEVSIGSYLKLFMPVHLPMSGEDKGQPSVLGVDFLEKTKAKFFFDPSKRKAYFEIEEK